MRNVANIYLNAVIFEQELIENFVSIQVNQITHWLDGSNIYGSEDNEASELRAFVGGRLASQVIKSFFCLRHVKQNVTLFHSQASSFGKELLPTDRNNGDCQGRSQSFCFKAGKVFLGTQIKQKIMLILFQATVA